MFSRGADKLAMDPSAIGVVARAAAICQRATYCSTRANGEGMSCDLCRRQAEAELLREQKLRESARRRRQLLPRDRIK